MRPVAKPNAPAVVSPAELKQAVQGLQTLSPWPGFTKAMLGLAGMCVLSYISMSQKSVGAFVFWSVVTGLFYAPVILLTHDAMHRTLTGWKWFDEIYPRFIAYPMLWYHGIYAALHDIHHKMNGADIRDPERPQWTQKEYESAGSIRRWCMRHQIWLNCLVWGGFGFLFMHYYQAYKFYKSSRPVRLAIWTDVAGVLFTQGWINAWAIAEGKWIQAFCFFIILERILGCFHQYRAWIEHYGLWGKQENPFETQIRNSRNIKTNRFTSFYLDHLNYHSVHHAFPQIPFYNLREAHRRLQALYGKIGDPMKEDSSYMMTGWKLATHPVVIQEGSTRSREQVIPMSSIP